MHRNHRLSYANITATLALFLAVGGSAAAGAQALLTGREVKDGSLTAADIQNHSLTGAEIRSGSLGSNLFSTAARANLRGASGATGAQGAPGAPGAQGPAGAGVTLATATGPDVTGYIDLTPLGTAPLTRASDYVLFARITAHNTGATDDNLNCNLSIDGATFGGGGAGIPSGATVSFSAIGAISLTGPKTATLACQGNGVTTYDIANITIRVHDLG